MKKFATHALAGALVAAVAATTVFVTVEAASAKTFVKGCEKVKLSADKTVARQTSALWNRLGPMSGMCAAPK